MRHVITAVVLLVLFCNISAAQEDFPKVEIFGGYSFLKLGLLPIEWVNFDFSESF